MYKILFTFPLFIFLSMCNNNDDTVDCAAVSCLSNTFSIEIIDKETGDNLLLNETYKKDDIVILNKNNEELPFELVQREDKNYISVFLNSTQTEIIAYQFKIGTTIDFNTTLDIEKTGDADPCCGTPIEVKEITVTGISYTETPLKYSITVFVE